MDEKVTLYRDINSDKEDGQEPVYKRWFPKTTDECVIITDGEIAEEVTLKTRIEQLKLKIADLEKEASVFSESIGDIKNLPNEMTDIVSAVTKNAEDISQQNSNINRIVRKMVTVTVNVTSGQGTYDLRRNNLSGGNCIPVIYNIEGTKWNQVTVAIQNDLLIVGYNDNGNGTASVKIFEFKNLP